MRTVSRRAIAGLSTGVLLAALGAVGVPAGGQEGPPECPPAPAGAVVVLLPFEELYANRGDAAATGSTVTADVPAGRYDIRLTAWDDHVIGGTVKATQLREVYRVEGFSGGSVVFTTEETPDLPDEENTLTAFVNADVPVPALDSLRAVHGDPGADETPNSIHPICIAFIPVQQDTTTSTVPDTTSTTIVETTSTTVPDTTSSTVDVTTTSTTAPQTTTTIGPETTTTTVDVAPTTTPSTTPSTLPFTGEGSQALVYLALLSLAAGTGLVLTTRRSVEVTR